jgi:tRNA nucleotidyltransferase (CCA-adding enzyme)
MDVVVSHSNADFDALASLVAARKLYPGSHAVLIGNPDRNVREFLRLHEHRLDLVSAREVELDRVSRLIIVETQTPQRLGPFARLLENHQIEVHLYDHHPLQPRRIRTDLAYCAKVGATTTLLIRFLRAKKISLSPLEATILALGIYEDTGCLTFRSTTAEDAQAVSFLLEQGANLDVVAGFIHHALTPEQRAVLNQMLLSTSYHEIHGLQLAVATVHTEEYVDELAMLTHKLCDLENVDAVFTLTEVGNHVYVVGRSKSDAIDVGKILSQVGGGGHHRAAAAHLRDTSLPGAYEQILELFRSCTHPQTVAADIMSYPVRTVTPDIPVETAAKVMLRYGHSGLPVMQGDRLVGIVSRKDIDRARHHELHHTPVQQIMTRDLVIASPQTSLVELERLIIQHDIGRIPIVEDGKVCGIVTRSDILRARHGELRARHYTTYLSPSPLRQDLEKALEERLRPDLREILKIAGQLGDELQFPVFVVGGFVRDLLLGEPNQDVDLLIEGDGIAFAHRLAQKLGARLVTHERFGTAVVIPPGGFKLDIATARTEFYEFPAALPTTEFSSMKQDLYRRDFTINAMAIQLNQDHFGELIDFFGGYRDLQEGVVRVLHNLSFVEDPTRILRAVRFEQRYGFRMSRQTEELLVHALATDIFGRLTNERIGRELILLLSEPNPVPGIHRLAHLEVLQHIHPDLCFNEEILEELEALREAVSWYEGLKQKDPITSWIVFFFPFAAQIPKTGLRRLCQRLHLRDEHTRLLHVAVSDIASLMDFLEQDSLRPSVVCEKLQSYPKELLVWAYARGNPHSRNLLTQFLCQWQYVETQIRGRDLIARGYRPGPAFGRALRQARAARLDGIARSYAEELQIAERILRETSPCER